MIGISDKKSKDMQDQGDLIKIGSVNNCVIDIYIHDLQYCDNWVRYTIFIN